VPTAPGLTDVRALFQSLPFVRPVSRFLKRNTRELDTDQVAYFHHFGYLIMNPGIPDRVIDAAAAVMKSRPDMKNATHHGTRLFDGWKDYPAIREIALAPRVLRMLRQLYGRKPRPFQTINFPIGTEQRVHSDVIHFNCDPPTYMCGVWVALEDIDESNGALVYYPGSHKLKVISMEDVAPGPGPQHYPLYEDFVEKFIAKSGIAPERAILKKGQALIWASNLYHGGGTHPDKTKTRHSQVTHYYFEGCQYYMPLESYGGYRHLKIDEWVK
jgi:hypothetical protein